MKKEKKKSKKKISSYKCKKMNFKKYREAGKSYRYTFIDFEKKKKIIFRS